MRAVFAAAFFSSTLGSPTTLDCPLRQIAVDYAQKLQPSRPVSVFSELADALNGAQEAQGCSVAPKPPAGGPAAASRMPAFPLPPPGAHLVFVDAAAALSAAADGSAERPFPTLQAALAAVRAARAAKGISAAAAPRAHLVLRAGTFYLGASGPLTLTAADSNVNVQAFPGEEVFISGGTPLAGVAWAPASPPPRDLWEYKNGALAPGFDILPAQSMTLAAAQALCESTPGCAAIGYSGAPAPSGPVTVSFKHKVFWAASPGGAVWVLNRGYLPGGNNLFTADVAAFGLSEIEALRVGGTRAIRARYPNAVTVEDMDAMQVVASRWTPQSSIGWNKNAEYTVQLPPLRDDAAPDGHGVPYFTVPRLGVGGDCARRFTPAASYWCANYTQGGGPGPYSAPIGMTVSSANESLPHTPYTSDVSRALVHSWRAGRWFSWVFGVDSVAYDGASGQSTFNFSLTRGGNQGSRGGDAGQEFFIENVKEELDAPGEFFFEPSTSTLWLWHNASGAPPTDGSVVAALQTVLINATGTQAEPVVGVGFQGIGFRDTAPNYMGPHGTPSGGDWAVGRSAAVFFEGAVGANIDGCLFTTLDGNALFFSGYNRNASVTNSEFVSVGETAVAQWGYTESSGVPGMGFDGTDGNQPRGTYVGYNVMHEVGLYTKQNSFYFQSEVIATLIEGNIMYNGPRAGVNFDDGFGGGSVLTKNLIANACRESSDHGPFNSWNRQAYWWDGPDGQPTHWKQNDTISYNFILANYHSSMAIDNDDGSAFYDTHHNVLWSASSAAAYGGNSLKSDFGGHSNFHHHNLDLFWSQGFGICQQLPGFEDGYYNNWLYLAKDGNYGGGQNCTVPGGSIVHDNTVWSPTGAVTECGKSLAAYQATGGDPGTTASSYPDDSVVLGIARQLMGLV